MPQAAEAAGVSKRTAAKWVARYRAGEPTGRPLLGPQASALANAKADDSRRSRP